MERSRETIDNGSELEEEEGASAGKEDDGESQEHFWFSCAVAADSLGFGLAVVPGAEDIEDGRRF
jgi:hypothetical protein